MRKEIVSRVAGSAQWRSSTTKTTGSISARRWKTPRIASNRRGWTVSVWRRVRPTRAPERRDEPRQIVTRTADDGLEHVRLEGPHERRRASTIGPYGTPP